MKLSGSPLNSCIRERDDCKNKEKMAYPGNDHHFSFLLSSSFPIKKKCLVDFEIGPKVHKKGRAVVFGRPRGPLFTSAARLCGTARNYFQPSVCVRNENKKCIPHTEKRDIMMAIITPSKSLKISLQHKREKQEAKKRFFFLYA